MDLTGWMEQHGRKYRVIVVDCLTMWLSNHFERGSKEAQIVDDMQAFIQAVKRMGARVVLVANELGLGLVPGDPTSRRFRELAGAINRLVAEGADEAHLVVSGLSLRLK